MSFRLANADDVDAVVEIFIAARSTATPWLDQDLSVENIEPWIAGLIDAGATWVYEEATVVAFMTLHAPALLLENLYVHPSAQGKGIGSALLAYARRLVPHELSLWAFQRNTAALAFYKAHGFDETEWTDGSRNMEREPDVKLVDES